MVNIMILVMLENLQMVKLLFIIIFLIHLEVDRIYEKQILALYINMNQRLQIDELHYYMMHQQIKHNLSYKSWPDRLYQQHNKGIQVAKQRYSQEKRFCETPMYTCTKSNFCNLWFYQPVFLTIVCCGFRSSFNCAKYYFSFTIACNNNNNVMTDRMVRNIPKKMKILLQIDHASNEMKPTLTVLTERVGLMEVSILGWFD